MVFMELLEVILLDWGGVVVLRYAVSWTRNVALVFRRLIPLRTTGWCGLHVIRLLYYYHVFTTTCLPLTYMQSFHRHDEVFQVNFPVEYHSSSLIFVFRLRVNPLRGYMSPQ